MSNELVTLATYRSAPKADLARALLAEEGIQAFVADATAVTADWFLGNAVGYVKLEVPASQADAALELLRRHPQLLDTGPPTAPDEDGTTKCLACGAEMPDDDDDVCPACGWTYDAAPDDAAPGDDEADAE